MNNGNVFFEISKLLMIIVSPLVKLRGLVTFVHLLDRYGNLFLHFSHSIVLFVILLSYFVGRNQYFVFQESGSITSTSL